MGKKLFGPDRDPEIEAATLAVTGATQADKRYFDDDPDETSRSPVDNGLMRTFSTGATRDTGKRKLEYAGFLNPLVLERFAQYMDKHRVNSDGSLRACDNWQRGMPRRVYLESLLRHAIDAWGFMVGHPTKRARAEGTDLEDALCGVLFNAQGLLLETLLGRDVQ